AAKTNPPALIACEYGPAAGGASFVETASFDVGAAISAAATTNPSKFCMAVPLLGSSMHRGIAKREELLQAVCATGASRIRVVAQASACRGPSAQGDEVDGPGGGL